MEEVRCSYLREEFSRLGQRTVSGITLMLEQSKEAKVAGLEETSDYVGTFRIPL